MEKNKKTKKIKRIAIDIEADKHMEIKLAATASGLSIKDFIENALFAYSNLLKNKGELDEN